MTRGFRVPDKVLTRIFDHGISTRGEEVATYSVKERHDVGLYHEPEAPLGAVVFMAAEQPTTYEFVDLPEVLALLRSVLEGGS